MTNAVMIAGASSGIGFALSQMILKRDMAVIAVGRESAHLNNLSALNKKSVLAIHADVTTESGMEKIASHIANLPKNWCLKYYVHALSELSPTRLLDMPVGDFKNQIALDTSVPLQLIQFIFPQLKPKGRIIFLNSLASQMYIPYFGNLCMAKAALSMLAKSLAQELLSDEIFVTSLDPGLVDTVSQAEIRQLSETQFPAVRHFQRFYRENKYLSPALAAKFIAWLLIDADASTYATFHLWNIYDRSHHAAWLTPGAQLPKVC